MQKNIDQKIRQIQWIKQEMDLAPLFGGLVCFALAKPLQDFIGESYGIFILHFKKGEGGVYFSKRRIDRLGQYYLKNKAKIKEYYNHWLDIVSELTRTAEIIKTTNLKTLTNEDLIELFEKIKKLFIQGWIESGFIETYDHRSQEILEEIIKKYNLNYLSYSEITTLLEPEKLAIVQQERIDFIKILRKVKKKESNVDRLLLTHRDKYYFMNANYARGDELSLDELRKRLAVDLKKDDFEKEAIELGKLAKHYKNLPKGKEKIIRTNKVPNEAVGLFNYFSTLSGWRDARKKMHQIGSIAIQAIVSEITRRIGVEKELAPYIFIDDLTDIFKRKDLTDILKERAKESVVLIEDSGNIEWFFATEAEDIKKQIEKTIIGEGTREIRGMVAYLGLVTGTAKVINNTKSFAKFNHDDVLISSMTRVEFMPVVRKASAIVTDEGGITCHAAIVSRELEIPCIVGTRVATKIIQDGDFVEVDANHGIVKIIKK